MSFERGLLDQRGGSIGKQDRRDPAPLRQSAAVSARRTHAAPTARTSALVAASRQHAGGEPSFQVGFTRRLRNRHRSFLFRRRCRRQVGDEFREGITRSARGEYREVGQ
jgi:hypothetical protein